ncbi:unnamed protein product [Boreogadus saida]
MGPDRLTNGDALGGLPLVLLGSRCRGSVRVLQRSSCLHSPPYVVTGLENEPGFKDTTRGNASLIVAPGLPPPSRQVSPIPLIGGKVQVLSVAVWWVGVVYPVLHDPSGPFRPSLHRKIQRSWETPVRPSAFALSTVLPFVAKVCIAAFNKVLLTLWLCIVFTAYMFGSTS